MRGHVTTAVVWSGASPSLSHHLSFSVSHPQSLLLSLSLHLSLSGLFLSASFSVSPCLSLSICISIYLSACLLGTFQDSGRTQYWGPIVYWETSDALVLANHKLGIHVRLTSPSFAMWRGLLNDMYNVITVQLNSTPVITCYHSFILCL